MIGKNVVHALKLFANNVRVMSRADVLIEKNVTLKYVDSLSFGSHVTLQSGCYLYGSRRGAQVKLGDSVVVAAGAMLLGEGGIEVGDFTHIGPGAVCTSQYGDANGEKVTQTPNIKVAPIRVGRGCWIGSGAVLMPGVVLGDETIVAPNSVVYGTFAAGSKVSGNPARKDRVLQ